MAHPIKTGSRCDECLMKYKEKHVLIVKCEWFPKSIFVSGMKIGDFFFLSAHNNSIG
jgi:hypothetical protein